MVLYVNAIEMKLCVDWRLIGRPYIAFALQWNILNLADNRSRSFWFFIAGHFLNKRR